MTGREWKPGDVARFVGRNIDTLVFRYRDFDAESDEWMTSTEGGGYPRADELLPLVVIDPESVVFEGEGDDDENRIPEIVNCLRRIAEDDGGRTWRARLCVRLADEFERQARPLKPAEPTGLGAVVEDAKGERWIRAARIAHGWHRPMGTWAAYAEIDAVRVLSEGVTL